MINNKFFLLASEIFLPQTDAFLPQAAFSFSAEEGGCYLLSGITVKESTVLLSCLSGLLKPLAGQILLNGIPIADSQCAIGCLLNTRHLAELMPQLPEQPDFSKSQQLEQCFLLNHSASSFCRIALPLSSSTGSRKQQYKLLCEIFSKTELILLDDPFQPDSLLSKDDLFHEFTTHFLQKGCTILYSEPNDCRPSIQNKSGFQLETALR